jgi:hypothetical protein
MEDTDSVEKIVREQTQEKKSGKQYIHFDIMILIL